jgi:hypothetical protein
LAGTTPQTGQLENTFARFGHGVCGLFLEGFADQITIRSHFADRTIDRPATKTVQATLSKRDDVTLDCGPTNPNDFRSLLARHPVV